MKHIPTTLLLALVLAAITIATNAPTQRHSMAIEQVDRTTNKWDDPAMPSPCQLDPTLQGCGELNIYPLPDVCELDPTLQGCGDPDYK